MKLSTSIFRKLLLGTIIIAPILVQAQSSPDSLNMDANYNRPFMQSSGTTAIGGYLEANSLYSTTDGVTEGLSFQARRMSVFLYSSIAKRINFMSELEIEEGGSHIAIEFAAVDIAFNTAFNLRSGIVMNPIGSFNQNHDGPKWEFVNRPDMAVNLLPATWANPGAGIYGKFYKGRWTLGYELYLTNGFNSSIVDNLENRTFLPASKDDAERFEHSFSGSPLTTGKIALKNRKIGELGLSFMTGVYNKHETDGVVLDNPRTVTVYAVDFRTTIKKINTDVIAEVASINVDVPVTYSEQYGNKQLGAFVDVVTQIAQFDFMDWQDSKLNFATRIDYVDWNIGTFNETDTEKGDELFAITPALSYRPTNDTVLRLNYRYQWQKDILLNPAALTATWMLGISSYF